MEDNEEIQVKKTRVMKIFAKQNTIEIDSKSIDEKRWKIVFWVVAAIIFSIFLILAPRIGTPGDEWLDGLNGKYALKYYTEGDTTFVDYASDDLLKGYPHMKYYGVGFEILPAIALKYFHLNPASEFPFRHFLCVCFGMIFIIFTGLTGKLIGNWKIGILSLLFIASTPLVFGLSFIATKDIPFAAGFAVSNYAFLAICKELPSFKIKYIVLAIIGIAISISVRIGGLLLPMYFAIAIFLKILCDKITRQALFSKPFMFLGKTIGICTLIVIIGCLIGLSFYPNFFYEGPLTHIKNAFILVSKFKQRIPFVFDGKMFDSINLPEHYLILSLVKTLPYYIFIGAFLFCLFLLKILKKHNINSIIYLIFVSVFPLIYVSVSKANIYNGWRHELFFYSSFIVLISIGWYELLASLRTKVKNEKIFYPIVIAVMIGIVSPTLIWMTKNIGYTYCYYNKSVENPYLKYELDYLETSATKAYEWLRENEFCKTDSVITVSTKIFTPVYYAEMLHDTNHVKVFTTSYMGFAETDCDYSIINFNVIRPKAIKHFFPPKGTIHVEYVDGNPICAVVKRNKLDSRGIKLIREGKFAEGMESLNAAYKYDPNNFGIWIWMGYGNYQIGQYEESVKFMDKALEFDQDQDRMKMGNEYKGLSLSALKRYGEAAAALKIAESLCKDDNELAFLKANIGLAYYNNKEYANAVTYLQQIIGKYPQLNGALQESMSKKNSQPEARPSNTSDSSSNKSTSDLFKLK